MKKLLLTLLLLSPTLVSAQSVDILYAGNTYTPPFYQGGALWSQESTLTLFALPQGLGDPSQLTYKWRRGTTVLGNLSGVGRGVLTYTDSVFSKPQNFSVEIVALDDTVLASTYINITPSAPSLLVYEKHPLYGFLWNHEASPGYQLTAAETSFAAFPLFFSTPSRVDPALTYVWRSNAREDSSESVVTYRTPEGGSGQASVSVKVTNPPTIRQVGEKSFLVQFNNDNK